MKPRSKKGAGVFFGLASLCILLLSIGPIAEAAAPTISYIDTYPPNKVRIHFDTEPNRTYILQYANAWSPKIAATNWSNLYTALSYPISSHYIIQDVRTTAARVYRLKVTP